MIVTISGTPGSGKSTAGKLIAKKLGLRYYSIGNLMRSMAKEKGLTLGELGELAKTDNGKIDHELDDMQIKLGETENNFVIDGRLSFHFLPKSIKIFISADVEERARRIYSDIVNGLRNSETADSLIDEISKIKKREEIEIERYEQYYKINPFDNQNYDLVIDSTDISSEQVVQKVLEFISLV